MNILSYVGIVTVILVFIRFTIKIGKTLPIIELMLLIAGLQWIVGPLIEYQLPSFHYKYYMYVTEDIYMNFVVPAYIFFVLGTLIGLKAYKGITLKINDIQRFKYYGLYIFGIGVFFDLISNSLPGTLGFVAFLLGNFKFAGAIILFFSKDQKFKKIFYISIGYLFLRAIQSAMFHDLILWSVFFYMFWALQNRPTLTKIYITILVGLLSLSTLQTIKGAYRAEIWKGYQGNKLELFMNLFIDVALNNSSNSEALSGELNVARLNQGWIISAILNEVPNRTPFFKGSTILEAISASILPRFLNPNKKVAGGRENFMAFTGLLLGQNTSMGISIIGEAYGNFDNLGGILFMGVWGLFLGLIWRILIKKTQFNYLFFAFLPILFLQVVKAETELVVVLNHLVKSTIVVFLFFWFTKRFLKWNFEK
jgi:hypothetical protein